MPSLSEFQLPMMGMRLNEFRQHCWDRLQEPKAQRKLVLVTVCIALLLDNMLYMVIVPIIPVYLRRIGAWETKEWSKEDALTEKNEITKLYSNVTGNYTITDINQTMKINVRAILLEYEGEDSGIGLLFASKAAIQIFIGPLAGVIIDRFGYDLPMMFGLTIMFSSTLLFAVGDSYGLLFFARSLQGVGSAFADTGGLSMIADRYSEETERSKALGIALAFISFGCLVAPPFGGVLYEVAGKALPFVILAFICLFDGILVLLTMHPTKAKQVDEGHVRPRGTSIWRLLIDPHIGCCAGALVVANVSLAFLEPTISKWMNETMDASEWQQGMIWLPAFLPHLAGVMLTVKYAKKFPEWTWALAGIGLALEGVSCFFVPFCTNYFVLMVPISLICFGIALIDTALLPMLGFIVDKKYVSVYGSVFAIADISYCAAYAVGPVVAGHIVEAVGFTALNICVAMVSLAYAPALYYLKDMHAYLAYNEDDNLSHGDEIVEPDHGIPMPGMEKDRIARQEIQQLQETNFSQDQQSGQSYNPFRTHNPKNPFRTQNQKNPFRIHNQKNPVMS